MIQGCISKYVCKDGSIVLGNSVVVPESRMIIYDILRVCEGIPLFCELHAQRFFRSFELANIPAPISTDFFIECLYKFIASENLLEGNIRCAYHVNANSDFVVYEVEHSYPTSQMYKQGVEVDLLSAERENPNIKQELNVRTLANKAIAETGVYEVLFVDATQHITEGSRSNVFFIKGGEVHTAPAADVLCGITRKNVFDVFHKHAILVIERKISVDELSQFDAAFISSTPFKILPISKIQNFTYDVTHKLLVNMIHAFDKKIQNYIHINKK